MPEDSGDDRTGWWDRAYEGGEVPWDTGRPQPEVVALERSGRVRGRVLDVGCGTGEEARYLADRGWDVVGVDFSEVAVERARNRTADGGPSFLVGDALALPNLDLGTFDTVIDRGLFHALEAEDRETYAGALWSVLADGGRAFCLEFGVDAPEDWGPTPISAATLRRSFADRWRLKVVEPVPFETRQGVVPGILGVAERASDDGTTTASDRSA